MTNEIISSTEQSEPSRFNETYKKFFERSVNLVEAVKLAFGGEPASWSFQDLIVLTLNKLCVDDCNAIFLLCVNGFGDAAIQILRGLYERLVTARYLQLHPEKRDSFWDYHVVKVSKAKFDDILKDIDPDGTILDKFRVAQKSGSRKRLQPSWNKMDFVAMANEVGLGEHLRNAYYFPIEYVHPSATAIMTKWQVQSDDISVVERPNGSQLELANAVLSMAHYFLIEVIKLQIEHFNLNGDNPTFQKLSSDYKEIHRSDE